MCQAGVSKGQKSELSSELLFAAAPDSSATLRNQHHSPTTFIPSSLFFIQHYLCSVSGTLGDLEASHPKWRLLVGLTHRKVEQIQRAGFPFPFPVEFEVSYLCPDARYLENILLTAFCSLFPFHCQVEFGEGPMFWGLSSRFVQGGTSQGSLLGESPSVRCSRG